MLDAPAPAPRPLRFELALVVLVSLAVLVPGIWRYSLVDPWETHYGEVARMMLQNHDWVHTEWPQDGEGFRSKPVLSFWLMAASMRALGLAADGGYSGEMVHSAWTMLAIRLPFIGCAVLGLALLWWMLARLVSRRVAWLALLVVGSSPMFALVARQAIPDMPLTACVIGAISLLALALEDGERAITRRAAPGRRWAWDARHVVIGLVAVIVLTQAIYDAIYFATAPQLAVRGRIPSPALWLPLLMVLGLGALSQDGFRIARLPMLLVGGVWSAIANDPVASRQPGQSWWRHLHDDVLAPWDRRALDRLLVRVAVWAAIPLTAAAATAAIALQVRPGAALLPIAEVGGGTLLAWAAASAALRGRWPLASWRDAGAITERLLALSPITTMRQLYLIGGYALLGVSILAKGPPGLTVVAAVGVFHMLITRRWAALYAGDYELKRGLITMGIVAVPWHVAMYLKDGIRFIDEYLFTHILNRAGVGVDNSPGTFEYYTSQVGHGMWLWAALVPAALASGLLTARADDRHGRVRSLIVLWATAGFAVFALVQTKFHHYILPVVPAFGVLVAFWLDDLLAGRVRLHPLLAAIGAAIALLVCRDLVHEPERWIEMFVFRYDRPWPSGEPWQIDPSDGVLALGGVAAAAIAVAATRWRKLAVAGLVGAGLAIAGWALWVYMPVAGTHWGMGDAIRTYYDQRTIYGEKRVYFGRGQLADDWPAGAPWRFDSHIPADLQLGQPMTLTIEVRRPSDERTVEDELTLVGEVSAIGDHTIEVALPAAERARLAALAARGADGPRGRPPVRAVDADRLIAWQLYWRGENFWSGDEIWGYLPEMKTAFKLTDNVDFSRYLNDRARAPLGRRYFLVTEAGRVTTARTTLPTPRARDTFEVIDTTSNKFSLAAFWL